MIRFQPSRFTEVLSLSVNVRRQRLRPSAPRHGEIPSPIRPLPPHPVLQVEHQMVCG